LTILPEDLRLIADRCSVDVDIVDGRGISGALEFDAVSEPNKWWQPDLQDILPSRPHGDYRERTVNLLVRDAIENPDRVKEAMLIARPGDDGDSGMFYRDPTIANSEMKELFGDVLHDLYVVETAGGTRFLFPFHSDLPGNFIFPGRYKMFNGLILTFLATPGVAGSPVNSELLDAFYTLFNSVDDFSLLDRHALRLAREAARDNGVEKPERQATAETLVNRYADTLRGHPFFADAHRLIQQDLLTALGIRSIGRKDRVTAVLTVFYLHLALYFWRAAYSLEEQSSEFARFLIGQTGALEAVVKASNRTLEQSPFRGKIKFRVPFIGPRKVHDADPCAVSFREVNNQRLTLMPVNTSLLGAVRRLLPGDLTTFGDAADLLAKDSNLRRSFDGACWLTAFSICAQKLGEQQLADLRTIARASHQSGFEALRDVLIKSWRSELRRSTTDITAQLMRRGGKGLLATRGKVQYFEAGQDLLLILAKLITGNHPHEALRYEDFLERLSLYGLAPQHADEEDILADALHSLQLLEKYSDTGEAMYVKHFL
jgi:hypothetical protein